MLTTKVAVTDNKIVRLLCTPIALWEIYIERFQWFSIEVVVHVEDNRNSIKCVVIPTLVSANKYIEKYRPTKTRKDTCENTFSKICSVPSFIFSIYLDHFLTQYLKLTQMAISGGQLQLKNQWQNAHFLYHKVGQHENDDFHQNNSLIVFSGFDKEKNIINNKNEKLNHIQHMILELPVARILNKNNPAIAAQKSIVIMNLY